MTPEDEWDAAVAEQPEHGRVRARIERGDEERDAVADRMLAREMERRDASAHAAPSPVTRAEECPTAERVRDLHQQRDFYRDSLRRILGVTRPDGEALIALVEVGLRDVNLLSVANTQASDVCTSIEKFLGVQRADQAEPLHERLARLFLLAIERSRADARSERTLKRWQARARKAEARIAALTEERDGLTLRLGEQARRQIAKRKGGR